MFGTFGHQDPFVRQGNTFGWPHTAQTWSTGCTPNVVTAPHTFGLFNSSLQTISLPFAITKIYNRCGALTIKKREAPTMKKTNRT